MTDLNKVLTTGDVENGKITTVVEIPQGSSLKLEYNRKNGLFELDRSEPAVFAKPTNYGFIPATLDEDGDELDTLLMTHEPVPTGVVVNAKIVGVLKFVDGGEVDDKILCVPEDDRNNGNTVKCLSDVNPQLLKQIQHHFEHYKDLKKAGTTVVKGYGDVEEAKEVVRECVERYNKSQK